MPRILNLRVCLLTGPRLHRTQHHERSIELARLSTALVNCAVATLLAHRHAFPAHLLKTRLAKCRATCMLEIDAC